MRNRSVRFKLTLWFSLALIAVSAITFAAVRFTSRTVLRGTVRDYLIGTVEANVDKIKYVTEKSDSAANSYIPFGEGFLQIDLDFMDVINDVRTALYTSDGVMLYGENPLSRQTEGLSFEGSHTWYMEVDGTRYGLYDRKLNVDLPDGDSLWIRGVVPESESDAQLSKITRLSLILLPGVILLAVISGYILADRLLSPIRKIENAAEAITKGDDLKRRIETGKNNDEFARLSGIFNGMLDRLERSFESEKQFTSDASHELRTPTSVIIAQSDYILEKERTPQEYAEAFAVVRTQGGRMNALITDMLDYARMETDSSRYAFEPVDLSELVKDTADQMALIGAKGITVSSNISEGVTVNGNKLLLARLVQNLISNAYRYGKENGHTAVTLETSDGKAILSVADDGIGIAESEKEKIFDRFYRIDSSRSVRGTGLGLSMVKKIAELHGAGIVLESEPGKGSDFRIIFER